MNFGQILLTREQYENRRLFNRYLKKLKKVKQLIKDDKSRRQIKNEPLTTTLNIGNNKEQVFELNFYLKLCLVSKYFW